MPQGEINNNAYNNRFTKIAPKRRNFVKRNVESRSGDEQWMVIFNPKIIKKYEIVKDVPVDRYLLPKIQ